MESAPHILVVDDDREIRELLARFLEKHGLRATAVRDGIAMRQALAEWRIDLVVLDIMLPGEDGFALCRQLRATSSLPVIMLTAMGEATDRIVGLEMGADDYLAKPFNPRELLARIKAVLRRAPASQATAPTDGPMRFVGWSLDPARRELLSPQGGAVELSSGEFDLLLAFVQRPRRVLTRDQLLDLTKGRGAVLFDRSIDIQVSRLRRKIEADPRLPELIKTVRGGGYMFTASVEK